MSKELADAIEKDLTAEKSVRLRYEGLMATMDADIEYNPMELPISNTPQFPEIAFTESEKPGFSADIESSPLPRTKFSQLIDEKTHRL